MPTPRQPEAPTTSLYFGSTPLRPGWNLITLTEDFDTRRLSTPRSLYIWDAAKQQWYQPGPGELVPRGTAVWIYKDPNSPVAPEVTNQPPGEDGSGEGEQPGEDGSGEGEQPPPSEGGESKPQEPQNYLPDTVMPWLYWRGLPPGVVRVQQQFANVNKLGAVADQILRDSQKFWSDPAIQISLASLLGSVAQQYLTGSLADRSKLAKTVARILNNTRDEQERVFLKQLPYKIGTVDWLLWAIERQYQVPWARYLRQFFDMYNMGDMRVEDLAQKASNVSQKYQEYLKTITTIMSPQAKQLRLMLGLPEPEIPQIPQDVYIFGTEPPQPDQPQGPPPEQGEGAPPQAQTTPPSGQPPAQGSGQQGGGTAQPPAGGTQQGGGAQGGGAQQGGSGGSSGSSGSGGQGAYVVQYPPEVYEGLPALRFLRGELTPQQYLTLSATPTRVPALGNIEVPAAPNIGYRAYLTLAQSPVGIEALRSLWKAANRDFDAEMVTAEAAAPRGSAAETTLVRY